MDIIDSFRDDYWFLSNFHPATINMGGIMYPTSEHAFQALKSLDTMVRLEVSNITRAGNAKRFGRTIDLRPDWDHVKVDVMYHCVLAKFLQNSSLARKLITTGNAKLVEGNTWGDTYWGVCDGIGDNNLGKVLMAIREEIKPIYQSME